MSADMQAALVAVARVCHEANRAWCHANGDTSQVAWDDAPFELRNSTLNGIAFLLQLPEASDEALHNNWLAEKQAAGWVYGKVKDVEAKTHPCMVPFHHLDAANQSKDRLFASIVRALLVPVG